MQHITGQHVIKPSREIQIKSMNIKEILGVVGIILIFVGYIPYIKDTISGRTTPHIFSWFLWSFLAFIGFGIQYSHGAGPSAWITLTTSIITLFIALVALKNGSKNITPIDYLFLTLALIAVFLWKVVKLPEIATMLQLSAGIIALGPTIRKSWNKPQEETLFTYILNSVRHGITFTAVQNYSINTALHPLTWFIANTLCTIMLVVRRRQLRV